MSKILCIYLCFSAMTISWNFTMLEDDHYFVEMSFARTFQLIYPCVACAILVSRSLAFSEALDASPHSGLRTSAAVGAARRPVAPYSPERTCLNMSEVIVRTSHNETRTDPNMWIGDKWRYKSPYFETWHSFLSLSLCKVAAVQKYQLGFCIFKT